MTHLYWRFIAARERYPLAGSLNIKASALHRLVGLILPYPDPADVLMIETSHFKLPPGQTNPMSADGALEQVNSVRAANQWSVFVHGLRWHGLGVSILHGAPGLHDQLYTANPFMTLPPLAPGQRPRAVIGRMQLEHRKQEPDIFKKFFADCAYDLIEFSSDIENFECTGDVLKIPGINFAFANVRQRTSLTALEELASLTNLHLGVLTTRGPFYHLDTAMFMVPNPLAPHRPYIVYWPPAFGPAALKMIDHFFAPDQQILITDRHEAEAGFAGNGFGLPQQDKPTVALAKSAPKTARVLRDRGLRVLEFEFDEIHKGGGSLFCCKGLWFGPAWDLDRVLGPLWKVPDIVRPSAAPYYSVTYRHKP